MNQSIYISLFLIPFNVVKQIVLCLQGGINVDNIFNGLTYVRDIVIKTTMLMLLLSTLTFTFDTINSKLDKPKQFGYDYDNNISIGTTRNNFGENNVASTVVGFCYSVICFIMQVMNGLLLKVALSIEFDGIIVVIGELVAILDVQPSMSAVTGHKQVIHGVCTVFYYLCCFFLWFWFL